MSEDEPAWLWDLRAFVYGSFARTARPPSVSETAAQLGLTPAEAEAGYRELHRRHALYLEPGTTTIRMANPFSGVPTPFRVISGGQSYWANCAWDALGVPAALGQDAVIETACAEDGSPLTLRVDGAAVSGHGERIHFLVPFRRWYEDLVFT